MCLAIFYSLIVVAWFNIPSNSAHTQPLSQTIAGVHIAATRGTHAIAQTPVNNWTLQLQVGRELICIVLIRNVCIFQKQWPYTNKTAVKQTSNTLGFRLYALEMVVGGYCSNWGREKGRGAWTLLACTGPLITWLVHTCDTKVWTCSLRPKYAHSKATVNGYFSLEACLIVTPSCGGARSCLSSDRIDTGNGYCADRY